MYYEYYVGNYLDMLKYGFFINFFLVLYCRYQFCSTLKLSKIEHGLKNKCSILKLLNNLRNIFKTTIIQELFLSKLIFTVMLPT